jgi:ribosome maturation factor RimP
MSLGSTRERLSALLARVVADHGLDLEGIELSPAGRRRLLRIVVDRDGGVGLDVVATVSQAVSQALDDSDAMGGSPYVLEVTSPGVDRPLTQPRHWRRARTRLVHADLASGHDLTGRVLETDDDAAVLEVQGEPRRVRYADVAQARVQVEFSRPADADVDDEADDTGEEEA